MKKSIFLAFVLCACFSLNISAQYSTNSSNTKVTQPSPDQNINFRLYYIPERGVFLELDTRSGRIYDIWDSPNPFTSELKIPICGPFVAESDQKPGRFFLNYTNDPCNFVLLDQISGKCWLITWDLDPMKIKVYIL